MFGFFRSDYTGQVTCGVSTLLAAELEMLESAREVFWETHIGRVQKFHEAIQRVRPFQAKEAKAAAALKEELAAVVEATARRDPRVPERANDDCIRALVISSLIPYVAAGKIEGLEAAWATYHESLRRLGISR